LNPLNDKSRINLFVLIYSLNLQNDSYKNHLKKITITFFTITNLKKLIL